MIIYGMYLSVSTNMNIKRSLKEILEDKKLIAQALEDAKVIASLSEEPTISQKELIEEQKIFIPTVQKKLSLKEIMDNAAIALQIAKEQHITIPIPAVITSAMIEEDSQLHIPTPIIKDTSTFSLDITLNANQLLAKDLALSGKSFCLIGAAGTGKTTAQREVAKSLLQSGNLSTHTFKVQGTQDYISCPSIAFVAYTRIASGNLRKAICKDPELEAQLWYNVTTIHNLLEFAPETYIDFEGIEHFRFSPRRTASNRLSITHLVIEESSLVDLTLWKMLYDALEEGVQIIFIGDINQLPPVFGPSILNYALTALPVVELTHVYRQAGDSLILENAHRILEGRNVLEGKGFKIVECGTVQHSQAKLSTSLGITFPKWEEAGEYDPDQDIILSPFNKQDLGTDVINKWIAQRLGTKRNAIVHEIVAGIAKLYLAVGDKIMYNKQVGVIKRISKNAQYMGKAPKHPGTNLARFGEYVGIASDAEEEFELAGYDNLDIDKILDKEEDLTRIASHIIDIETQDGIEYTLESIGDFAPANFSLGYALTVHKAQGCEWRKVFLVLHRDHSTLLFRELLYTAITRAKEEVVIIAKRTVIEKAIRTQRLKGNTLKDKIEYFNAGLLNSEIIPCTK